VAQAVQYLLYEHEDLSSNSGPTKKKKKETEKGRLIVKAQLEQWNQLLETKPISRRSLRPREQSRKKKTWTLCDLKTKSKK
jgi:hypothetical protein